VGQLIPHLEQRASSREIFLTRDFHLKKRNSVIGRWRPSGIDPKVKKNQSKRGDWDCYTRRKGGGSGCRAGASSSAEEIDA